MTIEELNTEIEKQEAAAEKEEQNNSAAGQMSAIVNQARYKRQVDELKEKDQLQKEEFSSQVRGYLADITDSESRVRQMIMQNDAQIKKVESINNKDFVINVTQAKHEVHYREIKVDKIVLQASHEVKVAVLERERDEITEDVRREFRKRLADMEVNILAYQDLLLTKDAEIRTFEAKLVHQETGDTASGLVSEIEQLKALLIEK